MKKRKVCGFFCLLLCLSTAGLAMEEGESATPSKNTSPTPTSVNWRKILRVEFADENEAYAFRLTRHELLNLFVNKAKSNSFDGAEVAGAFGDFSFDKRRRGIEKLVLLNLLYEKLTLPIPRGYQSIVPDEFSSPRLMVFKLYNTLALSLLEQTNDGLSDFEFVMLRNNACAVQIPLHALDKKLQDLFLNSGGIFAHNDVKASQYKTELDAGQYQLTAEQMSEVADLMTAIELSREVSSDDPNNDLPSLID